VKRKVECYHPNLYPTQWNQPKPDKWEGFTCDCGKNWICTVCGYGEGSYPCGCYKPSIKLTSWELHEELLEQSLIENAAIWDFLAFESKE